MASEAHFEKVNECSTCATGAIETDMNRSHLDTVRAVAFHPTELCLATGGDDCTVKIWRMDVSSLATAALVLLLSWSNRTCADAFV